MLPFIYTFISWKFWLIWIYIFMFFTANTWFLWQELTKSIMMLQISSYKGFLLYFPILIFFIIDLLTYSLWYLYWKYKKPIIKKDLSILELWFLKLLPIVNIFTNFVYWTTSEKNYVRNLLKIIIANLLGVIIYLVSMNFSDKFIALID
jgi:hypothetical protein